MKQTWVNVNGVYRKVINVWQKVNGLWVERVIPKGKVNGVWKDFMQYMLQVYEYGVEYINIVNRYGVGGFTKHSNYFELTSSDFGGNYAVVETPVDLTNFSTLYIEWEQSAYNIYHHSHFGVTINETGTGFEKQISVTSKFDRRVDSIDVSSISGDYHIFVRARRSGTSSQGSTKIKVHRIWGE